VTNGVGGVIEADITDEGDITTRLAALSDPELIARWASLRARLAYKTDPRHDEVKREYDAVVVEYRRRIDGVS
jgi:hypothetical protein